MAVIFEEQVVSGFAASEDFMGLYVWQTTPALFSLTIGESYIVNWDGTTYECVAQDASAMNGLSGTVGLGDLTEVGGSGNGEPFILGYVPYTDYVGFISFDTKTEHTIGISTVEEGILLRDNKGEDVAYYGVENILVRTTTDGTTPSGQQIFTKGEAVEGVEIELALADGDQTVNAPDGKLIKSAVIKKPDTLIPANILKGVIIAGVEGEIDTEEYDGTVVINEGE